MKARVEMEFGNRLVISLTEVHVSEHHRVTNIELALLHAYQRHTACAWFKTGESYTVQFIRNPSTPADAETARKVLRGFALEV